MKATINRMETHNLDLITVRRLCFVLFFSAMLFGKTETSYFFSIAVLLFALASLQRLSTFGEILADRLVLLSLLFCMFSLMSVTWSVDKELSLNMSIRLILQFSIYVFFIKYLLENGVLLGIKNILIFLTLLNFTIFIFPGLYPYPVSVQGWRFLGTAHNANYFAIFFTFSLAVLLYEANRNTVIRLLPLVLVCSVLIFATGSRKGAVVCLLLFGWFFLFQRQRISLFVFLLIILLSLLFFLEAVGLSKLSFDSRTLEYFGGLYSAVRDLESGDSSSRYRFYLINEGLRIWEQNSIVGVGIDGFQSFIGEDLYAHNNYVELLADLGVVGFLIYYSIICGMCYSFWRARKMSFVYLWLICVIPILDFGMVSYSERYYWVFLFYFYYRSKSDRGLL